MWKGLYYKSIPPPPLLRLRLYLKAQGLSEFEQGKKYIQSGRLNCPFFFINLIHLLGKKTNLGCLFIQLYLLVLLFPSLPAIKIIYFVDNNAVT